VVRHGIGVGQLLSGTPRTIAVVVGTRPEAIKMAPVVRALRERPAVFRASVVATAQHRQLLDQALGMFGITPDVDLDLMQENQQLSGLTARLLTGLEAQWVRERPDLVLVQGDTTSSFAAGLVAFYLGIPLGHIEAGLRTGDKRAPFPEEMNRRLVDVLCDCYFAPTESARANLRREQVPDDRILVTGNTGIDALLWTLDRIRKNGFTPAGLDPSIWTHDTLVLVTAHRRESFGEGFLNICAALRSLAKARPDIALLYSVHPNPNVRIPVQQQLAGIPNIYITEAMDYESFVYVMNRATVILTDSGGIQEEAPSFGAPVLVMRTTTERTEAVDDGVAELVGTDPDRIVARTLDRLREGRTAAPPANPFGDGHAAERIAQFVEERFS
jgi:UDP-N-acetylglucosamine 2-epimerase (non-hydrolysing)